MDAPPPKRPGIKLKIPNGNVRELSDAEARVLEVPFALCENLDVPLTDNMGQPLLFPFD
jgi:hypothetical protein